MIWLDIIALTSTTSVLLLSKTFYGRLLGGALITHYIAATLSEFGGGNVQPLIRLFSFIIIFIGTGLSLIMLFAQSNRNKEEVER